MSFLWRQRLNEEASDLLKHYYADILRRPEMLEALHAYDKAQLIMLAESGRPPASVIRQLVLAIAAMEEKGVVAEREPLWNVVHGGGRTICASTAARKQRAGFTSGALARRSGWWPHVWRSVKN